jgi:hypothetical protein
MRYNYPYLQDSAFLKMFDKIRNKEQYVNITVLTFDEKPIKSIQGQVTSGTLNLDASSTIRRTCSLSLVATEAENDLTNVNNIFSINKKVEVEIGFINNTKYYTEFEKIWFPLGVFVITSPSLSHATDGVNISLQLKDKMCLLNGECGGTLPASITFHEYDTIDENGEYITVKTTIYQIIQELVNHYGGEQLGKIIISDVDTRVKQTMRWIGSDPLYITTTYSNGSTQYSASTTKPTNSTYNKYEYGDDIGYIYTDFVYPGELIGDAGNTVCTILDTIKNTLGNYEYFYDINGNFVFQEIKNYLNTSQATIELQNMSSGDYLMDYSKGKSVYQFDDCTMFTSCTNSPQFNMIKNDFVVWGVREDVEGYAYPIRYHLAIDSKPAIGNTYQVFFYTDPDDGLTKAKCSMVYEKYQNFPAVGSEGVFYKAKDRNNIIYKWDTAKSQYVAIIDDTTHRPITEKDITTDDWRTELYLQGAAAEPLGSDSNYYYSELCNEWPKLYDVENGKFIDDLNGTDIDFYLDFIDSSAAISELSVSNIGRRTKVLSDDSINCIFEPDIPDLVIIESGQDDTTTLVTECKNKGQAYMQVDSKIYEAIATGGTKNSAYNTVRELLYQYTSYNETITISSIPIFYLEPNTRITVRDSQCGIYGDYMINSISIPFDTSSTMTLSCTRVLERI